MIKMGINQIEEIAIDIANVNINKKKNPLRWKYLSEWKLWTELVSCILGSQVPFEHACSALDRLIRMSLITPKMIIRNPSLNEKKISRELTKPIYKPYRKNGCGRRYRYPNMRASQICQSAIALYSNGTSLKKILKMNSDRAVRNWLVENCYGIGPKQASLFLRNIEYTLELAIIDSHVLEFMREKELIDQQLRSINSRHQYDQLENVFIEYANEVRIRPGTLDRAIWAVMSQVKVGVVV